MTTKMEGQMMWLCWLSQPAEFQPDLDTFPVAHRHTAQYIITLSLSSPRPESQSPPSSRWFPDPLHLGDESEFARLHVANRRTATHTNTASRPSRHRPQKARTHCVDHETPCRPWDTACKGKTQRVAPLPATSQMTP